MATSGTRDMAQKWFEHLGIRRPKYFITANDVKQGKPHPEPYLKGRNGLGYPINEQDPSKSKVVVFEDAPAGIAAGKAAGCKIIGIATTFDLDFLKEKAATSLLKTTNPSELAATMPKQTKLNSFLTTTYMLRTIC